MKRYLLITSYMLSWLLASCASNVEKPQAIHFAIGGGTSDDFRASKVFRIMGKTYDKDSLAKLTDNDIQYLNSLDSKQDYMAIANNIIITIYQGDKRTSKVITWNENNASLNAIALSLENQ